MSMTASLILFVGRCLFAGLFLFSARGHIVNRQRYVDTAKGRIPLPIVAGWPVGIWLLLAAASVILGAWPDIGVLMLAAFLIPAALLFHPFWRFKDPAQRRPQESNFYRNISLLGAAIVMFALFAAFGAGQFALTGPLIRLAA